MVSFQLDRVRSSLNRPEKIYESKLGERNEDSKGTVKEKQLISKHRKSIYVYGKLIICFRSRATINVQLIDEVKKSRVV